MSEPLTLIGLGVSEIFKYSESPEEIFPNRGIEEDEDNVVFYYPGGIYLFIYQNRVWQVRYDRTYTKSLLDAEMGMDRSQILIDSRAEGYVPLSEGDDFLTFQIFSVPYPVRIKMYFEEEKLDDLYVYRADF